MSLKDWEGLLPEENNEAYHKREQASSSQIKYMGKSPWHYKRIVIDGESEFSDDMDFGTLAHKVNLEGKFSELLVMPSSWETVADQKKRGVKEPIKVEDQKLAFKEEHGDMIVSQSDYLKLEGMEQSFRADDVVQSLICDSNMVEQGFAYWDENHEIECRFRPDIVNLEKGYLVDYKTAQSAQAHNFKWSIIKYGYQVSAAHYMAGLERLYPGRVKKFYFIVQEKKHPYACATYELSSTDLMFGMNLRDAYLKKIKKHTKLDYWPGYTSEIRPIEVPDTGYDMEELLDEA